MSPSLQANLIEPNHGCPVYDSGMSTRVIWRLREKNALQRCMKLAFPLAPASENPPDSLQMLVTKFAGDFSRFPDKFWTTLDCASVPFVWRQGRIRIQFQLIPPARVVRVLSVDVEDVDDGPYLSEPKCNQSMPLPQVAEPRKN